MKIFLMFLMIACQTSVHCTAYMGRYGVLRVGVYIACRFGVESLQIYPGKPDVNMIGCGLGWK